MREFQLIREIQRQSSRHAPEQPFGVELGIGDDAAVLEIPAGRRLVVATDTLNEGVHFLSETAASDIGYKCLAVNLSDLAAMGAVPHWALMSLSLPFSDVDWLKSFMTGFTELAELHGVSLVGGDTTRGPMSINVTAMGSIDRGAPMTRSGARPGELLVVSGSLGGAACALGRLKRGEPAPERELLDRPEPRLSLGNFLAGHASACIDISDGLLADLGHILDQSGCAAMVNLDSLPGTPGLAELADDERWRFQLSGGDDYELLFTLPRSLRDEVPTWRDMFGVDLTIIGEIEAGRGIRCIGPDGKAIEPERYGYEHFGNGL